MVRGVLGGPALAQEMPPAPVRFTEARSSVVRAEVVLTGTVRARTSSVVASEVAGLVVELRARAGDRVLRGEPIVRLRRQSLELQLDASRAELKEASARLDQARRSLERSRELFDSGVVSRQQLDDAMSEEQAWEGRVEASQAEIAHLEDELERSSIPAPFDGVIVAEQVDVGEWLDVGGSVVEMVSLDDLEVVTALPERYFERVTKGSEARVSFEALPGLEVAGEVAAVVPRADAQARTFPVKVGIPTADGRIGVGMLARVSFAAGAERSSVVVPKDAVVGQASGAIVYVIGEDDTANLHPVTTGAGIGDWIVVEGGLEPGDRVVVRGNERLMPGQKVAAEPLEYELP